MKKLLLVVGLVVAVTACSRGEAIDGTSANKPAETASAAGSTPSGTGTPTATPPPGVTPSAAATPASASAPDPVREPADREVTIPAGTVLPLTLRTTVGSETSNLEDQVRATLRRPISVGGVEVLPEGTVVIGHITDAARAAKVKGRARVAFRFTRVDLPGDGEPLSVRTGTVARVAPGTKKRDATTIGGGAVGGAIIGGILGGGDGAAKGAVIGGAGGTGVVLATRGKEVQVAAGTPLSVKLTAPLTVRVRRVK